jgi:hypothetical protein
VSGRLAGAETAGGRAGLEAAAAAGVTASMAPTPRATDAKTAAYLPTRAVGLEPIKLITRTPEYLYIGQCNTTYQIVSQDEKAEQKAVNG